MAETYNDRFSYSILTRCHQNAMAKIPKSHFYVILFILMSSIFNPLYYNYLTVIYIIYNRFTTVINYVLFI